MKNIKVLKIGGSILETPESFLNISKVILKNYRKSKICIVTSAIKGKTDALMDTFRRVGTENDFLNLERFLPLGEIESAILFEAAFKNLNVNARAILPWMKEWPLYISLKEKFLKRGVNEKRDFRVISLSKLKVKKYVLPLFKDYRVIIIPGFLAKDWKGRILTLGRGGSDISAILIGELLNVKEIIFLKDTGGILSIDPKISKRGKKIKFLDSENLGLLSSSGSKILNPLALKYAENIKKIKITSPNLEKGTEIEFDEKIKIKLEEETYSALTFIGEKLPQTPGILFKISKVLAEHGISIYSITISDNLIAIYLAEKDTEKGTKLLSSVINEIENLKILNVKRGIKKISIRSLKFINEPGVIKKIVTPIAREGINIWEILTVHTDIMIFVEKEYAEKTFEILNTLFGRRQGNENS